MASMPDYIDHIIYTAPTLEEGIDRIESLLGTRPIPGGRHPDFGTHNALLSIGESTYLEVIAPDPQHASPARGTWLASYFSRPPRLATWVLRSTDIRSLRQTAIAHGIQLGDVQAGQRET